MESVELLVEYVNADPLPSWPVTWWLALPPCSVGASEAGEDHVVLTPDGIARPADLRILAAHPDGSARRVLVTAEVPLPGPGSHRFRLERSGAAGGDCEALEVGREVVGHQKLAVSHRSDHLEILAETWHRLDLESVGGAAGEPPTELTWAFEGSSGARFDPFLVGRAAVGVVLYGSLLAGDRSVLEARLTLRLACRTPVILADLLLLNTSPAPVLLQSVALRLTRKEGAWESVDYEVRQLPRLNHSKPPVRAQAGRLELTVSDGGEQTHSGRLLNYNETWLAVGDGASRLLVALPGFFENYPYGFAVEPEEVRIDLWPAEWGQPWTLAPGAGKTHRLGLAFPPAGDDTWSDRALGHAMCKPPMPRVPLHTLQAAGVGDELPDYLPDRYPRCETTLYDLVHNRNRGYGKMHWGDDISLLYTNQLRGRGDVVWNNLEGDHPYHMWCQFVRTGRFDCHREFLDTILQWADVDFCDREGALHFHSAQHWTGGFSPCHNWAEGFKEWYFATGDPRALEVLGKMADWLVRRAEAGVFKMEPEPYVRGCGWGLIQLAALDEVLGRADLRGLMDDLAARLLLHCRAHGGLPMTIPTGGGWVPRDNAFHTATVVIGAWRCWRRTGLAAARELAVEAAEAFFDERTCTPEGIAVYIGGPEQDFPMQQAATLAMGALGVCWHLTGDPRYVRRGMRMLEYCLDRGMIVDHMRIPGQFLEFGPDVVLDIPLLMPNSQLLGYQLRGMLLFMQAAMETGMLREIEYRF
ncbi:MAG: hypothetical protein HYU66_23240 [Armatimonadetes bacterium]|nr:hypothetical protein [Armatimonadota bacterium]